MKAFFRCVVLASALNGIDAFAATFTVTVTNVTGAGSLQQAMTDANSNPGPDLITFSIPGAGPHIISPTDAQPLPSITSPVTIDGYTQTNASPNTLITSNNAVIKIRLDGVGVFTGGLVMTTGSNIVRGLSITRFTVTGGIVINSGANNNIIEGNFIGIDPASSGLNLRNQNGIYVFNSSGNVIGGTNPAARNIISGNNSRGISMQSANNNLIIGNVIGLAANGSRKDNFSDGINLFNASQNTIGGLTPETRNIISGNSGEGIYIDSSFNVVQGNYIGTDMTGTGSRSNLANGIMLDSATTNTIGGTNVGARNIISGNSHNGIRMRGPANGNQVLGNFIGTGANGTVAVPNGSNGVFFLELPAPSRFPSGNTIGSIAPGGSNLIAFNLTAGVFVSAGTNNSIRGNAIHSNTGLGIDLGTNGVTANDSGDGDTGANFQQNFPILTNAIVTRSNVTVQGTLNSRSNVTYQLDFYANTACDSSGNGEGQTWLTNAIVTTDATGNTNFSVSVPVSARDKFITATVTDTNGNTSELSACFQATVPTPPLTFTVINTNDSGSGSLRQALIDVDQELNFGRDTINFNVPGGGVKTIFPLSALPTPIDPVLIDGYTQPGTVQNTLLHGSNAELKICLDGSLAGGPGVDGLHLTARSNIVRGLCIVRFSGDGIEFQGSGGNFVRDVWLGFDIPEPAGFAKVKGQTGGPANATIPGSGGRGLYYNGSDYEQCDSVIMFENGGPGMEFYRPPGQTGGPFFSQILNSSSVSNGIAGFLFNASQVTCTSCDAASNPIGFAINGNDILSLNSTADNCGAGWVVNGNGNNCTDCNAYNITGNAFSNESGTGSDFNVLEFEDIGGAVIFNNNQAVPTGNSVETDGANTLRVRTTLTGPAGNYVIRVYYLQPNGPAIRVATTTVSKSSSDLAVNTTVTTSVPIPANSMIQFNVTTTAGGSSPLCSPVTAPLGTQPDLQTTATTFTPTTVNLGVKASVDFQVKNNGVGVATAGSLAISTTGTKIVNISVPSGATVSGPVNGVFTVSFGQIAAGETKTVTVTFVVPATGSFSLTGTATAIGQPEATTSNNTGSRSGTAALASGSPPAATDGDTPSAGKGRDPISLFTGELFNSFPADLNIGGPMPLGFSRYYASFLKRLGRVGTLGDNWRHNFEWTLTNRTTTVDVISDVGRRIIFTNNAGNYTLIGRQDTPFQLQTNGGNFILGDPRSQRLYIFDSSGKLTQIQDGHGNMHTLAYTGNNLAGVSDGLGRTLAFAYDSGGFLTNVTDGARSVALTQSGNNLASIRDPLGFVTTYAYDLTNATSGLMTNAVMPEGNVPYAQTYDSLGRVVSQTEAGTNTHTLTYAINLTTLTDPLGRTLRNVHTPSGELIAFTDESSLSLAMDYNTNGQRTAVADRLSNLTRLGYHVPSGYVSAITNTDGTSTTFTYTNRVFGGVTFFDVTRITYPDGATENFTYDSGGNVLTRTDRGGNVSAFTYNARGQVLTAQNPLGGVATFTYNANGTLASRADTDTGTTTFAYDSFSRLTNVVHPDGTMLKTVYDGNDRVTAITDERNNTYTFTYDDNGNVLSVTDPLSQTAQFAYDTRDRLLQTIDRLGKSSSVRYDQLDHVASITNRNGNVTGFTYDTRRRLTSITDSGNQVWNFGYDNEALLTSSSNPLSQTNRIRRDALGYETGFTNALNQSASLVRDTLRRVTQTVDGLKRTNGFGYDARGLLTNATAPVVGSAAYQRNSLGLLSRITDLNGSPWNFGYTPMGRAQFVADPLNRTNRFNYDNRGRSSVATFADGTTRSNSYDQASNPTRRQYSDGTDLPYTYDALNRLVTANGIGLAYDAESRVTNTLSSGVNFGAAYDAGGRLTNVTYNAGAFSITYTYDSRDRLVSVSDSLTGTTLNFTYDNAGRLTAVTRPNSVNGAYTYDAAGRLTRIQEGALIDLQYALDAAGQTTNLIYTLPLDPTNGLSQSTSNWTYDAAHQISNAGYAYDARGRLMTAPGRTYQYDAASRLKQINSVMLGYNGFSDIVTRAEAGTTNRYYYNHALGMRPIVAEKNETTGQILRYYVWSPGGRLLYLIDAANGNAVRHFHFDRVGSTLALTDAAGAATDSYAYTPYGELLGRTGTSQQPFLYVGRFGVRHEPTGNLVHMRARYYDPISGRFLSPDPIWPRLNAALELNPYQYVSENPLKSIDPSGLTGEDADIFMAEALQRFARGDIVGTLSTKTRQEKALESAKLAADMQKLQAERAQQLPPGQTSSLAGIFSVPGFQGGVRVAGGDVNADGVADIIPNVNQTPMTGFQGGVRVAVGDVNGDGVADIISNVPMPRSKQVQCLMSSGSIWGFLEAVFGEFFDFEPPMINDGTEKIDEVEESILEEIDEVIRII